jgi:hypothetical protein
MTDAAPTAPAPTAQAAKLAPLSPAERMARSRARRKKGLFCLTLEIRESEVDAFVRCGRIKPEERGSPAAIREAVYSLLKKPRRLDDADSRAQEAGDWLSWRSGLKDDRWAQTGGPRSRTASGNAAAWSWSAPSLGVPCFAGEATAAANLARTVCRQRGNAHAANSQRRPVF